MPDDEARANELRTTMDLFREARARLTPELWNYAVGGAETERTVSRNRLALDAITFSPRILQGVGSVDVGTTFLGLPLAMPVMLAPIGSIGFFHRDGALACARAAGRARTVAWVSTVAQPSLEDVAKGATCPLVFQLYIFGDRTWSEDMVHRAEDSGYAAICLTADTAAYGRREREIRDGFTRDNGVRPNIGATVARESFQASFTWTDAGWLRKTTSLPMVLKGVSSVQDAKLAVEHGFDAICVSNHGGRRLDYLPSTIEVLDEIVTAVGRHVEVIVDGGFVRGTDVIKALALGARAVLMGKAAVLALAGAGEPGLDRFLALVHEELRNSMALLGRRTVADLGRDCLRLPRFDCLVEASSLPWNIPADGRRGDAPTP